MSEAEVLQALYAYCDQHRDRSGVAACITQWLHERADALSLDDMRTVVVEALPPDSFEHFTTVELVDFMVSLSRKKQAAQSICDPTCGSGLLLAAAAAEHQAETLHGCDINVGMTSIAKRLLGDKALILDGDVMHALDQMQVTYDLIIAQPPLGIWASRLDGIPPLKDQRRADLGHALAVWSALHLGRHGCAVLALSASFLWTAHGEAALAAIHASGGCVTALIYLPPGTLPLVGAESYLAVIERGEQQAVFVGSYTDDDEDRATLLANLRKRKAGPRPELGRLCALDSFRGFPSFVAQERMRRLIRSSGWQGHPAPQVFHACERLREKGPERLEHGAQSCYLSIVGRMRASTDLDSLLEGKPRRRQHILHLHINPDLAEPRYLAHWFNDSQIGRSTLASISGGTVAVRVRPNDLMDESLAIHLPPVAQQQEVLHGAQMLRRICAEVDELETALWDGAGDTEAIVHSIATVNQEDRYEDWIESLPFPLASILWRHHAGGGSQRDQYEVLLHFFEATAAFIATVHLSAFMSDEGLWREYGGKLHGRMAQQHLSLDRATFGAWKLVVESLSSACGKLYRTDETVELVESLYGTSNRRVLTMLAHADLRKVLQQANKIRNDWSGHAGVVSNEQAAQVHAQLMDLVQALRSVFGRTWQSYELIQPGLARYGEDGYHHVTIKRLMGTRSAPFEEAERASAQPLVAEALYLFDDANRSALRLKPFVRVMPSPEKRANACFIFNRREGAGSRYVSYHFEQESNITEVFPDVEDALNRLHLFDEDRT